MQRLLIFLSLSFLHLRIAQAGLASCRDQCQVSNPSSFWSRVVMAFRPLFPCQGFVAFALLQISSASGAGKAFKSAESVEEEISRIQGQIGSRTTEMLAVFSWAAPSLGDLSHKKLADAIDSHEDFDNPESLRYEVSFFGSLQLYHSAPGDPWHVNLTTFRCLPSSEKKDLEAAVDGQIKKQRTLFPQRKVIQLASDVHLRPCWHGMRERLDGIAKLRSVKAKRAEAENAAMEITEAFNHFFEELAGKHVVKPIA